MGKIPPISSFNHNTAKLHGYLYIRTGVISSLKIGSQAFHRPNIYSVQNRIELVLGAPNFLPVFRLQEKRRAEIEALEAFKRQMEEDKIQAQKVGGSMHR